ncbi:MAG: aldehyde ferredoxin oxidoreductase N-terminal domain-containing protein [Desulfurococcaceae archaeon]
MKSYRVLFINTSNRSSQIVDYDLKEISGPIELGVKLHLEKYESWRKPIYSSDNVVVIGSGLFAGSKLYGSHRFTVVFRSPLTRGLHVASMGGAAYQFRVNADAVVVEGYSRKPLIVTIEGSSNGDVNVSFDEINEEELLAIWRGAGGFKGVYSFQRYLLDRYRDFFNKYISRALLVGPASKYTSMGALFSITIVKGEVDLGSEDYAARGGPGSVLYRAHGVASIIYGGEYDKSVIKPVELTDIRRLNDFFTKLTGKMYLQQVIEHGVKYRFDPKLNTGGTLGGNYPTLKTFVPMFNWNTMYMSQEVREKLYQFIMKHMWEPFNKEAIETKTWKTCGEPCPLACKKIRLGKFKSDYEPYNGCGPLIGVFDIHEAEKVVELVDSYGLDAIEAGNVIAFVFEAIHIGLLNPEEVGLSEKPYFNPDDYKVEFSKRNAELAVELVEKIAWGRNPILRLIGEKGLRSACKVLNILFEERVSKLNTSFNDLAVYAVFGEEGHITPNYYYTVGMIAPLPVLGRYWTLYKGVFIDPEDMAQQCYERAVKELGVDNACFCRFHRGWVEPVIDKLYEVMGINGYESRVRETYKLIAKYQKLAGSEPMFWDSKKTIDIVVRSAFDYRNEKWMNEFSKREVDAVKDWWSRFYTKLEKLVFE